VSYDLFTFRLKPHTVEQAERRLAEWHAANDHGAPSRLIAAFRTEIGPLNELIVFRTGAGEPGLAEKPDHPDWFGDGIREFTDDWNMETFEPLAISPPIVPGNVGPFFEIRTYAYAGGELPKIITAWELALPARTEVSPLLGVLYREDKSENKLVHIWPWRSLDERWAARRRIREAQLWPPWLVAQKRGLPGYDLLRMENRIVVACPFSPVQ
jgi:hypothetical protein